MLYRRWSLLLFFGATIRHTQGLSPVWSLRDGARCLRCLRDPRGAGTQTQISCTLNMRAAPAHPLTPVPRPDLEVERFSSAFKREKRSVWTGHWPRPVRIPPGNDTQVPS